MRQYTHGGGRKASRCGAGHITPHTAEGRNVTEHPECDDKLYTSAGCSRVEC